MQQKQQNFPMSHYTIHNAKSTHVACVLYLMRSFFGVTLPNVQYTSIGSRHMNELRVYRVTVAKNSNCFLFKLAATAVCLYMTAQQTRHIDPMLAHRLQRWSSIGSMCRVFWVTIVFY